MNRIRNTRLYRRVICLLLTAILVLSGCGSIVMSENLQFEVNPPITPLSGEAWITGGGSSAGGRSSREQAAENVRFAYGSTEKYGIGGTRAFTILPGHVSPADVPALNEVINNTNANLDPADALDLYVGDFKVLGYDDNTGRFVYSYYVPYLGDGEKHTDEKYPEIEDTGLSVKKSGNVGAGFVTARPQKISDIIGMVFVVMSYAPATGDYTVFFSKVFTMEEHKANDMRMPAGKVAGQPNYYAYADDFLYMYDRVGNKEYATNYNAIVQSKALYMLQMEVPKYNNVYLPGNLYMIPKSGYYQLGYSVGAGIRGYGLDLYFRWTVADVEMDENFMPYITLNLEYSFKDFAAADKESDDIVNNDEEVEDSDDGAVDGASAEKIGDITYFHGTFACLRISLDDSGMQFLSKISQDALDTLENDAITIVQEVCNYTDVRMTVAETVNQNPEPVPETATGLTGDQSIVYTAGEDGLYYTDQYDIIPVQPPSQPSVTIRQETYEETLDRLKNEYKDSTLSNEAEQYFIDKYLNDETVKTALSNFSIFDTQEIPGASGIYFALGGGSTGRDVSFYDADGNKMTSVQTPTVSSYGSFYNSLWTQYLSCIGNVAATANNNDYYIPFLKPGEFGGLDWAYYDVGKYHERNGSYALDDSAYFRGNAQPLVSSNIYLSNSFGYYNTGYISHELFVRPNKDGILHLMNCRGYDTTVEPTYLDYGMGYNQYYYNGSVLNGFRIRYNESYISGYTNSYVRELYKLHYYLPYVLAYHQTKYADGRTIGEYATIQNDDSFYVLPTMVPEETKEIKLTYQYVLTDGTRSDVYYMCTGKVTVPTKYRMAFPEGSYIQISGDVWIGNMVKAENQLGAITYYTTNGSRLYSDAVWNWSLRNKYPIYDNASGKTIDPNTYTFSTWLFWYFFREDAFWNFYKENSNKYFSTLQVNHQGSSSVIYDRLVPGQAQDLGVWNVDGKNYVAYFTDQVIRFYEYSDTEKKYRATAQISIDELQMLSEGYFLREKTDGWVESVSTESESVASIAEDAMNNDDTKISLNSDNILPIAGGLSRFLYFSEAGSLYLMTLLNGSNSDADKWQKHGRLMPLMDGTYYRVFDTTGSYKVVGFQTSSYSYVSADQCMARVYDIDIDALVKARADDSVNMYLENLRNIYLSDNHTLLRTVTEVTAESNGTKPENAEKQYEVSYSIVPPDTTDPEYSRALRLFTTESMNDALKELDVICREYNVSRSAGMEAKLQELRENLQSQRIALREMYNLLGINFIGLPTSWQYIQYEGYLYNASHQSILETMMVQIVLSDDYLDKSITPQLNGFDGLIGLHTYDPNTDTDDVRFLDEKYTGGEKIVDEFAEYREQYRLWLQSSRGNIDSLDGIDEEDMSQLLVTTYNGDYISEITDMDFYDKVLDEIKETYLRSLN